MIVFTKDINPNKLRMAYNNDVIRFYSDSTATALSCDVTIGSSLTLTLYPDPAGQFFFNFMAYVQALINTRNFEDTVQTAITGSSPAAFLYDVTAGTYLDSDVTLGITLDGSTDPDTVTHNLAWLAGVQQWGDSGDYTVNDLLLLLPLQEGSANSYYAKYWQGYPFDLGFYSRNNSMSLTNETNLLSLAINAPGYCTRLFLSDGRTNETLEDLLPLTQGHNLLRLQAQGDGAGTGKFISLEKMPYKTGVYLKWLNAMGGYSYWLFEDTYAIDRSTKDLGGIDRDNANLEDSFGRTAQIGRQSQDTLKIVAELLTENERTLVQGLLDSPKIYLFTGQPFARNGSRDWIEVGLKTTSARIKNPREALTNFTFDIELPVRYSQTL